MAKAINPKLVFIFPDIHYPQHDPVALEVALKAHAVLRPGRTIQLGDLMDCSGYSSYDGKTLDEMKDYDFMGQEVVPSNKFIDRCLKNTHKYVGMAGNHEYRIERFCITHGIAGASAYHVLSPAYFLGMGRSRKEFHYVPYCSTSDPTSYYRITKDLVAVHGWSFAKNAARVHLDMARSQSVVYGHTHRQELVATRDPFSNRVIKAFSPGCLSRLQPMYATGGSPTTWSHGFSLIYVGSTSWTEYNLTISRGAVVLPDGREIRA